MSATLTQLKTRGFYCFCPQKGASLVRQKLSSGSCVDVAKSVPFCY